MNEFIESFLAKKIRNKFYFSLILYPTIVLILGVILNVYSENYSEIFISFFKVGIVFIGLNILLGYYIFRPIENYFYKKSEFDIILKSRILDLPVLAAASFFAVAFIYSLISLLMLKIYYENTFTFEILIRVFNRNCILGTIFTYFMIENYTIGLKEYFFNKSGIILKEQNNKILFKLILAYIAISFSPILELYFLINPYLEGLSGNIIMQITAISTMLIIMIILSAYIITRGFKRPMNVLLKSFKRTEEGNYSQIPITSTDEMGKIASNYNKMLVGLKEREFIKDTFGKFVTKEVVAEILNSTQINKLGEKRNLSIMFTDIESYTSITEDMNPEDVVIMLNEYFKALVGIIQKHKGIVNKFIGDAVMAFYNAPLEDPDHAENAVKAAIEIDEYVNSHKFLNNTIKLPTRMGINTDDVVVGNIGSDNRLEYTVIGDGVNVASRLESLNKNFGRYILIGENTYQIVKERFSFTEVTKTKLKGKDKTTKVYGLK